MKYSFLYADGLIIMHLLYVKSIVFMVFLKKQSYDTKAPVKFVRIFITRLSVDCRNRDFIEIQIMTEIFSDLMHHLIY